MADKEAIYAAWDGNERVEDIAVAHSLSIPRIYQIVAARGKPLGKAGRPRKAQPVEVISAIESGMPQANAAVAFGITRGRVTQILGEHAPGLLAKLRAERGARAVSERTLKMRALKVRHTTGATSVKLRAKADDRKRPKNWQVATQRAVARAKNQSEAAAKLGLSVGGLRRRLREIQPATA